MTPSTRQSKSSRAWRVTVSGAAAVVVPIIAGVGLVLGAGPAGASGNTYLTTASPSLNVRSAPSTSGSVVGSLPYHSTITIVCQTTGSNVNGSSIWDEIGAGRYVADYWVNTPNYGSYSPGLAVCSAPPPPSGPGTYGQTTGSNPFPGGQCTWGADNLAHIYMASDPSAYPAGHNYIYVWGNADQWPSFAAAHGWTVVSHPVLHSIVVFQPGVQGADRTYGHVAWVTAVNGNGTFQIEEMNATAGANYDYRTVSAASGESFILVPPFS